MEEQQKEFKQRGQEVVNQIQVNKLSTLVKALDEEILTDNRKRHFVTIDRLDENWVDDPRRYRLIRALIETMRDFNSKMRFAKIIIALRTDLFDRVLWATTGAGFQDEKYRGLCFPITWKRKDLQEVLDARINELVQSRYTSQQVTHKDIMPGVIGGSKAGTRPLDYILDRTLLRPRDVISYLNICIGKAEGDPTIRPQTIVDAEVEYSQGRLNSLKDEWSVHYQYLIPICGLFRGCPASFKLGEISGHSLDELCLRLFEEGEELGYTEDARALETYYGGRAQSKNVGPELRASIARMLYRVGVVGFKTEAFSQVMWSYDGGRSEMPASHISDETTVHMHRMLWGALGIRER